MSSLPSLLKSPAVLALKPAKLYSASPKILMSCVPGERYKGLRKCCSALHDVNDAGCQTVRTGARGADDQVAQSVAIHIAGAYANSGVIIDLFSDHDESIGSVKVTDIEICRESVRFPKDHGDSTRVF
jgi:hypothetical protein